MMQKNIFEHIKNNISIIDVAKKFPDFYNTLQKSGSDYGTSCPTGHASSSGRSFKLAVNKNFYICHSCGITGSPFNLVQELTDWDTKTIIDWFIREFNLDEGYRHYTKHEKTPEEKAEEEKANIYNILFEHLLEEGKRLLFEPEGKKALDYLVTHRKYDPEIIKTVDFMYMPTAVDAKAILYDSYNCFKDHIKEMKLISGFGDLFRIGIPFRSGNGLITGFILRADVPGGVSGTTYNGVPFTNQRWTSTPGTNKDVLFGIHKIKHTDTLLIVEGYPDVTYLPAIGYKNIVGFGQAKFGNKQLQNLLQKNIKNVILALDNDGVGPANTAATTKILLKNNINVYVLDPRKMAPHKDPDEYVVANGVEAFEKIVKQAESGLTWAVEYSYNIREDTPKGKNDAFQESLEYGKLVTNSLYLEDLFVNKLAEKSELNKRQIGTFLAKARKQVIEDSVDSEVEKQLTEEDIDKERVKLIKHLYASPVLPFQDKEGKDYWMYDKKFDIMTLVSSKDKLENACMDAGIGLPPVLPSLRIDFRPQMFEKVDAENNIINLFTPTHYMYWKANGLIIDPEVSCPYIMRVLKNLIKDPDGKGYMKRFFNWLAYIFQYRTRSNVAWVFMGSQGTGKNMMFENIIKPFFGDKLAGVMDNHEAHSEYNSKLREKLFMVFDEVANSNAERNALAARLKVYIAGENLITREIYGRNLTTANHLNCMFFSNAQMPVVLDPSDRRYVVMQSDTPLTSLPDWDYYVWTDAIEKEKELFYQFLLNYAVDLKQAKQAFVTDAKSDLIDASMNRFEQFGFALCSYKWNWLNDQLHDAYITKGNQFEKEKYVTQSEIEAGYMTADRARELFQEIFPDTKITASGFTRQLKACGIESSRKYLDGVQKRILVWNKTLLESDIDKSNQDQQDS